MKSTVFAILLLVAGAFAFPQVDTSSSSGLVEQRIENAIKRYSAFVKLLGLDPLEVKESETVYAPLPGVFEVRAFAEDLTFSGASDIAINHVEYTSALGRLRFDFSMPELLLTLGKSGVEIVLLDNVDTVELSGSLAVRGVTLAGEISFNLNWEGITVRSITLDLSFGRTEADLKLVAFEKDYSENLNSLLGERIPSFLDSSKNEINRGLEVFVRRILDIVL